MRTDRYGRGRELTFGLLVAAILAILALAPSAAHAAGCDNWTNTAGGSWSTGTNWSKKAPPTSEEEACITEKGTYSVELTGLEVHVKSLTLGGTSGTQTLIVGSTCSVNSLLATTSGTGVGAHGAITVTNADSCGDSDTISGPLTNAGTINIETKNGGKRKLEGNLTNTGTVNVNATTEYNGASAALSNQGALNVAEGKELQVSNKASVTNGTGGKIAGGSTGIVALGSGTSFTEAAGTTSGSQPVLVDDGTLAYTGTGSSLIKLRGNSTLSGNLSSGQTLAIESSCSENATATAAASFTNGGSITETNSDSCSDNVALVTPEGDTLTNSGTLTTEPAKGGTRTVKGNLENTGTININAATEYNAAVATLTNEGTLNLAEAKALNVRTGSGVTNGSGGKIVATGTGTGQVSEIGGTFTEAAGTTSGSQPVLVDDAALAYTGTGSSLIKLRGNSTLSGNLASGQTLLIESTCSENVTVTAAASFTNAGSITETNGDGCSDSATLTTPEGDTLTNSGTLTTEPAIGGARAVKGSLENTGTININTATEYNAAVATLTNEGTINLAEAKALNVRSGSGVTNGSGGKIVGTGTGQVSEINGTFTEGAGTTSGSQPVQIDDAALAYTGTGSSLIKLRGNSTLSGNLASGQTLLIESTCSENATVNAAASFTNAGSIKLTNGDGCSNGETLAVGAGATLTNSGTITTEVAIGGARALQGNLTNKGTLAINETTQYNAGATTLTNDGSIDIANGVTLSAPSGQTIGNEGGTIATTGSGVLSQSTGTFIEGAGKTSGSQPVLLDDVALKYVGTGASVIAIRGTSTLGGTAGKKGLINKGQTLSIQSSCSENATLNAPKFVNSGTIVLTNGDGCSNSASLKLGSEMLENKGKITAETKIGGTRTIEADLVNAKTVVVTQGETLHVTGAYSQGSKGTFETFIAGSSSFGAMSVSGAVTLGGKLKIKQVKPFVAKAGETFTIVSAGSLTGTFAKLSGNKIKGGHEYAPVYTSTTMSLLVK